MPHDIFALRIAAEIDAIPVLLDRLEAYVHALALPEVIGNRLALVCEEFAANTAMHGGSASYVEITLRAQPHVIHIAIEDDGTAFNPLLQADADTALCVEERPVGGLGIYFMRRMLRNMVYERRAGCNCLTAELHWTSQVENNVPND